MLKGDLLRPIFDEYHVRRAVLFGSYAKGCATEKSDVDILVDSGLIGCPFSDKILTYKIERHTYE